MAVILEWDSKAKRHVFTFPFKVSKLGFSEGICALFTYQKYAYYIMPKVPTCEIQEM